MEDALRALEQQVSALQNQNAALQTQLRRPSSRRNGLLPVCWKGGALRGADSFGRATCGALSIPGSSEVPGAREGRCALIGETLHDERVAAVR